MAVVTWNNSWTNLNDWAKQNINASTFNILISTRNNKQKEEWLANATKYHSPACCSNWHPLIYKWVSTSYFQLPLRCSIFKWIADNRLKYRQLLTSLHRYFKPSVEKCLLYITITVITIPKCRYGIPWICTPEYQHISFPQLLSHQWFRRSGSLWRHHGHRSYLHLNPPIGMKLPPLLDRRDCLLLSESDKEIPKYP